MEFGDQQLLCNCYDGYSGPYCEDVHVCDPNPCSNNGKCEGLNDDMMVSCSCPVGWSGRLCTEGTVYLTFTIHEI